jgi:hypothetical protein
MDAVQRPYGDGLDLILSKMNPGLRDGLSLYESISYDWNRLLNEKFSTDQKDHVILPVSGMVAQSVNPL